MNKLTKAVGALLVSMTAVITGCGGMSVTDYALWCGETISTLNEPLDVEGDILKQEFLARVDKAAEVYATEQGVSPEGLEARAFALGFHWLAAGLLEERPIALVGIVLDELERLGGGVDDLQFTVRRQFEPHLGEYREFALARAHADLEILRGRLEHMSNQWAETNPPGVFRDWHGAVESSLSALLIRIELGEELDIEQERLRVAVEYVALDSEDRAVLEAANCAW